MYRPLGWLVVSVVRQSWSFWSLLFGLVCVLMDGCCACTFPMNWNHKEDVGGVFRVVLGALPEIFLEPLQGPCTAQIAYKTLVRP